ncbi:hypothetical protein PF007_g31911 [Phytophthora fragariae]|nr:hypothetical protein PF009_g32920 [Phytophthora fragariae]KAE9056450.1 hypothetical protein PF006_g32673 [Phytophthora fragariae]KAE9056678.1 hypothetical protein PF007_g31911 [Phytophthora fragariae]KAE9260668.1 hypothetical protein PF008_g33045 [Phytophthora fragariae]
MLAHPSTPTHMPVHPRVLSPMQMPVRQRVRSPTRMLVHPHPRLMLVVPMRTPMSALAPAITVA